jgi:hypothetical protein
VELHTHAMHGVVHANGFGHLLRVNGREGQGKRITGGQLMGLWERICYSLRVRCDPTEVAPMKVALIGPITASRI